jgi:uncharacterized protein involved in copper resistance
MFGPMRRAQAILVVLTLAALPVVMLAHTTQHAGCDGMCCVRHRAHSTASSGESQEMSCHHGAMGHMFECGMKSNQHSLDFGAIAPIGPTRFSSMINLWPPAIYRSLIERATRNSSAGFLPDFFEPPRA